MNRSIYRVMRRALVAVVLALIAALVPIAPAAAASCTPSGGEQIPRPPAPPGDFQIIGAGWGHGTGMSQYGAQGAARLGCDAETILRTYYAGAEVAATTTPDAIRVALDTAAGSVPVEAGADLPWELCANGSCGPLPVVQPGGSTWTVNVQPDGSYLLTDGAAERWRGGNRDQVLRARHDGTVVRLPAAGKRLRWGLLEFDSVPGGNGSVMLVNLEVAFERYLYGLGEMPSSWPQAALEAQAIAARSFALVRREAYRGERPGCRCDVYASVLDQVYAGYDKEAEPTHGARWVSAVDATAGLTVRYGGRTVSALYSSTHGGHSESGRFAFGGDAPYLRPVDDSRWELASDSAKAGVRSWALAVSADQLGAAAGVGRAVAVTMLEPRGAAGRAGDPARGYGGVRVEGSEGTKVVSGDTLRKGLQLRSTLFEIVSGRAAPPVPLDPVTRFAGGERIGTAVAVSAAHWPSSSDVVLATAERFPDALASGALAAKLGAPLLLNPAEQLSPAVEQELARLQAARVWVLGGEQALSAAVEQRLRELGVEVRRLAGDDRYATAGLVALEAGPSSSGEVALVLGADWPDAVAAGSLAATPERIPTLLAERERLPDSTVAALAALQPERVLLVGGRRSLGTEVEEHLEELGYEVVRLSGDSRFDTAAAVASSAGERLDAGQRPVVLVSGGNYPDALPAGALAARLGAVLVLVPGADLRAAPATVEFLNARADTFTSAVIVGGPAAVSDLARDQAGAAITGLAL